MVRREAWCAGQGARASARAGSGVPLGVGGLHRGLPLGGGGLLMCVWALCEVRARSG